MHLGVKLQRGGYFWCVCFSTCHGGHGSVVLHQEPAKNSAPLVFDGMPPQTSAHQVFNDLPQRDKDATHAKMVEFTAPMELAAVAHMLLDEWPLAGFVWEVDFAEKCLSVDQTIFGGHVVHHSEEFRHGLDFHDLLQHVVFE